MADFDFSMLVTAKAETNELRSAEKDVEALANAETRAGDAADTLAAKTGKSGAAVENSGKRARKAADDFDAVGKKTSEATTKVFVAEQRLEAALTSLDIVLGKAKTTAEDNAVAQQRIGAAVAGAQARVAQATLNLDNAQRRYNQSGADMVNTSRAQQFAIRNIGQQVGDFGLQLNSGASFSQAFGNQIGQLGFALGQLEKGPLARVGAFLVGPLGIAFTIALATVVPVIAAFVDFGNALDDATDKLKKEADETEIGRQAKERFKVSAEGVAQAIREGTAETEKEIAATRSSAEVANIAAKQNLEREISIRRITAANLEQARSDLAIQQQRAAGPGQRGETAAIGLVDSQNKVDALSSRIADNDKLIAQAEARVNATRVNLAAELADKQSTAVGRITLDYDRQISAAKRAALESAKAGGTITAALTREIAALERRKKAAIAAQQAEEQRQKSATKAAAAESARGGTTSFLSPVSGGRITGQFGEARAGHQHAGVDIATPVGTPVRAPAAGTIDVAGQRQGYGNAIYINFGGGTTGRFGHLSKFNVKPGDRVEAGDIIGESGGAPGEPGSGRSTGAHLHYEVRQNGRAVDPRKGRFRTDAGQAGDDAQKRQDQAAKKAAEDLKKLGEFGERAADKIGRINSTFADAPKLITRANDATKELEATIADLEKRKPPNYQELIAQARATQQVVQDGIVRPYNDYIEQQQESLRIGQLVLEGRGQEAEAQRIILSLEEKMGPLSQARKDAVVATVDALREQQRQIDIVAEKNEKYVRSLGGIKSTLEDATQAFVRGDLGQLLKAPGKLLDNFATLKGDQLFEGLFGDAFRDLKDQANGTSEVKDASAKMAAAVDKVAQQTGRTSDTLAVLEAAAKGAANALSGSNLPTPDGGPVAATVGAIGGSGSLAGIFASVSGLIGGGGGVGTAGTRSGGPDLGFSLVQDQSKGLAGSLVQVGQAATTLDEAFQQIVKGDLFNTLIGGGGTQGTKAPGAKSAETAFANVAEKLAKGVGINDESASKIGKGVGKIFNDVSTGTLAAGIGKSLGIKTSQTGGQIGGFLGGQLGGLFGPVGKTLGPIVGGILGSVVGGLFKKSKTGSSALVLGTDGQLTSGAGTGNDASSNTAASGLAGQIAGALNSVAQQLGGSLQATPNISVGLKNGKVHVNAVGGQIGKKGSGDIGFGKDGEAAAATYAIQQAIAQGAVVGLSDAVQQALRSNSDVDKGLQEAIKVQNLETALGGVQGALDKAFKDYENQAKDRLRIARQYGLDVVATEKLNTEQRIALVDGLLKQRVGSLQSLLDDFRFGDLFEGDAQTRRANLLGQIEVTKGDVAKGTDGAADTLANLLRTLNSTSLDAFGTAGPEYAKDRADSMAAATQIIQAERARIEKASADQATGTAALVKQNELTNETNDLLASNNVALKAILAAFGSAGLGGGGGPVNVDATRRLAISI